MRYLITSALPYIHGVPHLGNFVGSILPADVMSRFLRFKGEEVLFICGSDMHGSPLEVAAFKAGRDVKEMAYENHEKIKSLMKEWMISVDYWGHTDSEENKETTYEIFERLYERGLIKEDEIVMPRCKNCGKYLADRWIEGTCPYCGGLARGDQCDDCGAILTPQQLINPRCVYCGSNEIEFRTVKQLVFDLPALKGDLKKFYEERKHLWPEYARSTTEWYLYKEGLKPRSITRYLNFGFSVPIEGFEDQVFYVWFDAPIGYIGITKQWAKETGKPDGWKRWWKHPQADDVFYIQYLGKDNVFFHTIMFPAMLIGSNDWKLVDVVASAMFLTAKGVKFSKSRGVGLNLESAKELLPVEYWRYVLMALFPASKDTEFSWDVLKEKINKELVDNISNFIYRTLKLSKEKNVAVPFEVSGAEIEKVNKLLEEVEKAYMNYLGFAKVISLANRIASEGNTWLNTTEPWKSDSPEESLRVSLYYVRALAGVLYPVLPETMGRILEGFGVKRWNDLKNPVIVSYPEPFKLFRRINDEELERWKERFSNTTEKEKRQITIDTVLSSNMETGLVRHVQDISGDEEHFLLILEDKEGNNVRALAKVKGKYRKEDLKHKTVLFVRLNEKRIHRGVTVGAVVPLAGDSIIISDRGVVGRVR